MHCSVSAVCCADGATWAFGASLSDLGAALGVCWYGCGAFLFGLLGVKRGRRSFAGADVP